MLRLPLRRRVGAALVVAVVVAGLVAWSAPGIMPARTDSALSSEARVQGSHSAAGLPAATSGRESLAAADPTATWTELSPSLMPPERVAGAMVWDSTDGYVLLFGGQDYGSLSDALYNDTWSYLHGTWTNLTNPSDAPPARDEFQMADDPSDHEVVVFGGYSEQHTILDDTWTYAGGVWTNRTATAGTPPPATFQGAMAYDNATGAVILFGGEHNVGTGYTNETWEFQDNSWSQLAPTNSPSPRDFPSMTYDPEAGDLVLFGGTNDTTTFNDTWVFSGTTWTLQTPSFSPDARWGAGIAYFATQSQVVLYGGSPANTYPFDTFGYASGTWTLYDTEDDSPGQTLGVVQMAYDYADGYVVLFQDTFTYVNSTWTLTFTSSPPPPALSVSASATPTSGTIPFPVAFASEISGGTPPYTATWNFGDSSPGVSGPPATAGNTSHTYDSVGAFNATLTVEDSADATVVQNWTIDAAAPALTLSIQASPTTVVVNATVTFTATPGGGVPPYTYSWTFGDQGTSSAENPTHAYAVAGKYTAQLVVTDHDGSTISRSVTINVTASTGPSPTTSTTNLWIYASIAIVLLVVALLAVLLLRRRKRDPTSPPPAPPASPGTGPSP